MTEVSGEQSQAANLGGLLWEVQGRGPKAPGRDSVRLKEAIISLPLLLEVTSGLPGQGQPELADHCQSQRLCCFVRIL